MPKRLHVLELAKFPEGPPVPGFFIELDDGSRTLVDAGIRPARPGAQREAIANYLMHQGFGEVDAAYTLDADGTQQLIDELARVGATPDDVDLVILTHLDFDHAGNVHLFPNAEVLVQRAAYWFAQTDGSMRSWPAKWENLDRPVRWRLLDGDTSVAPGLEVIDTSGHVPGHQSVLVDLPEGAVLITGDAAFAQSVFVADREPTRYDITADSVASTRKLLALAAARNVREVLFGHDSEQWLQVRGATYE